VHQLVKLGVVCQQPIVNSAEELLEVNVLAAMEFAVFSWVNCAFV
jgi:hypothetical protein